jgi:hypothetical protein
MDVLNQHIEHADAPGRHNGSASPAAEQSAELGSAQEPARPEQAERSTGGPMTGRMDDHQQWAAGYNRTVNAEYYAFVAVNTGDRNQAEVDNAPANAEQSAASAELNQHIDAQERGGQQLEGIPESAASREAAKDIADQYVERSERGENQEFRAAAREALDRHIDSPEKQQQQDIQQQPDIDRDL